MHFRSLAVVIAVLAYLFNIDQDKETRKKRVVTAMTSVFLLMTGVWWLWTKPIDPPLELNIPGGLSDAYISFWVSIAATFFGLNFVAIVAIIGLLAKRVREGL